MVDLLSIFGENTVMRKIISLFLFLLFTTAYSANGMLSMELTRGVAGAIPIAIVPFAKQGDLPPQDISAIVSNDLQNSGRFKVYTQNALSQFPSDLSQVSTQYFRHLGTDNVVVGKINSLGGDRFQVNFQLLDMFHGSETANMMLSRTYTVSGNDLRTLAHHISDLIYQQITGVRGVFSTKIAYVLVQRANDRPTRYVLELSDQDGYNPRPLLNSPEPIMSPSWSPNGKQLAYVSFEHGKAQIYLQDVLTGGRRLLSESPGINGAPAWSPNGRQLALVLSKSGSPNIYIMDIATQSLRQITKDFYINTEPSWSADGSSLLFTSNRGGGLQIYQINLTTGNTSRVSFDGDYNARAMATRDGKTIAMIHRVEGNYNIAVLDLDAGITRVLTNGATDSASPSFAPNGSMILYETVYSGRNVLAMVSTDGRVQLRLPPREGEAQDPAWSPFLS